MERGGVRDVPVPVPVPVPEREADKARPSRARASASASAPEAVRLSGIAQDSRGRLLPTINTGILPSYREERPLVLRNRRHAKNEQAPGRHSQKISASVRHDQQENKKISLAAAPSSVRSLRDPRGAHFSNQSNRINYSTKGRTELIRSPYMYHVQLPLRCQSCFERRLRRNYVGICTRTICRRWRRHRSQRLFR